MYFCSSNESQCGQRCNASLGIGGTVLHQRGPQGALALRRWRPQATLRQPCVQRHIHHLQQWIQLLGLWRANRQGGRYYRQYNPRSSQNRGIVKFIVSTPQMLISLSETLCNSNNYWKLFEFFLISISPFYQNAKIVFYQFTCKNINILRCPLTPPTTLPPLSRKTKPTHKQ